MRASVIATLLCALATAGDPAANSLPPETRDTPPGASLSRDTVVRLADAAASKKGYTLSKYLRPQVYYQFLKPDRTCTLFYDGKDAAPGNHFIVHVNDQSKAIDLFAGE